MSIVDRFACALGDHSWQHRWGGVSMACQWCNRVRSPADGAYDAKGRWRWPEEEAA